ncbi:hypothetical protein [Simiduia agarivorans]|nr:hypothetical protein [Simiduia agarivorans]
MRKYIIHVAIFLCSFVSGTLCAVSFANYYSERAWAFKADILKEESTWSSKFNVSMGSNIYDLVEKNDREGLLNFSCQLMDMFIEHIDPEVYRGSPGRVAEIKEEIEVYKNKIATLREQNYCGYTGENS